MPRLRYVTDEALAPLFVGRPGFLFNGYFRHSPTAKALLTWFVRDKMRNGKAQPVDSAPAAAFVDERWMVGEVLDRLSA